MSRLARPRVLGGCVAAAVLAGATAWAGERADVVWHPAHPRVGDVAWLHVRNVPEAARVEGSVDGRPLAFFRYAGGQAALVGIDLETRPGARSWGVAVLERDREPRTARGTVRFESRRFPVERLTLPRAMVDLDPDTERRAVAEGQRLTTLFREISTERLWQGRFTRPLAGAEAGTGFGARRIINGRPRAPHTGADYSAPLGTPVVAANTGRVALVGEFFFHGRLVVLDHGLGLYTLYFHLDSVAVKDDERVERGQTLGTVGASGRATGPHLHFAVQLGAARVDPEALLGLALND